MIRRPEASDKYLALCAVRARAMSKRLLRNFLVQFLASNPLGVKEALLRVGVKANLSPQKKTTERLYLAFLLLSIENERDPPRIGI